MIPNDFIQTLLNRLDIVDVVERYVPLKKAGANHVACCPFHNEKSPSFTVSQSKQFYHCFGCGAHGTAIGFVMEYAGTGFIDAVTDLASSVGLAVPVETATRINTGSNDQDLLGIMQRATQYYRDQLKQSPTAIAYLKQRGLSGEIAARFGIGYAPDAWQNLETIFPDYRAKALADTGLVIDNESGKRYDRFRDRIIFPILDQRGQIIGFGGRVLGAGEPKYLNSPETPLFEKGRELYGLFQARRAIRDKERVVVVEGYMDVVALAQHGIDYAVATLGTATTPTHVQKLLRQSDNVLFCFDGDDAGRRAAWRALENALGQLVDGKNVGFLFLPQGEDPDSYVRKFGREQFEKMLDSATSLSAFLLRELSGEVELQSQEGRAKLLQTAKPLLTQITAPMLNLMLRKSLAELAGVSQVELESLYSIKSVGKEIPVKSVQKAARKWRSIYANLMLCLMLKPELAKRFELTLIESEQSEIQTLIALLNFLQRHPEVTKAAGVIQFFSGSPHESLLREVEKELLPLDEATFDVEAEFTGALTRLSEIQRNQQIDELHNKLQREGWSDEDKVLYRQLQQRVIVE